MPFLLHIPFFVFSSFVNPCLYFAAASNSFFLCSVVKIFPKLNSPPSVKFANIPVFKFILPYNLINSISLFWINWQSFDSNKISTLYLTLLKILCQIDPLLDLTKALEYSNWCVVKFLYVDLVPIPI